MAAFLFAAGVDASASESCGTVSVNVSKKPARNYKEVTFATHLHCEDCVKKVQENIAFEKGVKDLDVSLEKQTIKIVYDAAKTDEAKLKAAVEKLGYHAEKVEPGSEKPDGDEHQHQHQLQEK